MLVGRLPNYGFFLDFFEGNTVLTKMDLSLNDYLAYFQWFTNCLIAANRFTVFAMPMSHKKVLYIFQLSCSRHFPATKGFNITTFSTTVKVAKGYAHGGGG